MCKCSKNVLNPMGQNQKSMQLKNTYKNLYFSNFHAAQVTIKKKTCVSYFWDPTKRCGPAARAA